MKVLFEKEISVESISVSPRPYWKCRNCRNYDKSPSCPPNAPSWKEFKELLQHYRKALLIKFEIGEDFENEKREILKFLLEKERELMRKGYTFALALFPGNCNLCEKCEVPCKFPEKMRFSLSAVGVEVVKLAKISSEENALIALVLVD
ncbi:MAG: DUF2284 domain-containing protein [Archaeoglobaceae archaeon]